MTDTAAATATMWVANAPCSYGTFELSDSAGASGEDILAAVAGAGYSGIDLGPVGLLGDAQTIGDALRRHQLALAGGWIQLRFADGTESIDRTEIDLVLDLFDAALQGSGAPPPRPTLADAGASQRRGLAPGMAAAHRDLGLDAAGWERMAVSVEWAVEICRARGYEPAFHPHVATWVEAPWEINQLMSTTTVGLCLDPGHLITGGGDVREVMALWGGRITQVHIKDVKRDVVARIGDDGGDAMEVWRQRAFVPLGEGDVNIASLIEDLRRRDYHGWLVVEQDVLPSEPGYFEQASADQRANREVLRGLGL